MLVLYIFLEWLYPATFYIFVGQALNVNQVVDEPTCIIQGTSNYSLICGNFSPCLWIVFNFSMSHRVWFYLKQPVLLVAFLRKFTCLCERCIVLSNLMIFEIDLFNFMVQIKYYKSKGISIMVWKFYTIKFKK